MNRTNDEELEGYTYKVKSFRPSSGRSTYPYPGMVLDPDCPPDRVYLMDKKTYGRLHVSPGLGLIVSSQRAFNHHMSEHLNHLMNEESSIWKSFNQRRKEMEQTPIERTSTWDPNEGLKFCVTKVSGVKGRGFKSKDYFIIKAGCQIRVVENLSEAKAVVMRLFLELYRPMFEMVSLKKARAPRKKKVAVAKVKA